MSGKRQRPKRERWKRRQEFLATADGGHAAVRCAGLIPTGKGNVRPCRNPGRHRSEADGRIYCPACARLRHLIPAEAGAKRHGGYDA